MSAVGVQETQEHHFDATTLQELGEAVDAFVHSDLGGWRLAGVSLDGEVRRAETFQGEAVRVIAVYRAAVTLTRWRRP